MRRANNSSRLAGTTMSNTGRMARSAADLSRSGGGRDEEAKPKSPLEALELEVEQLRKAIEAERAEVASMQENLGELFMRNACEEYLLKIEKRIQVIENKGIETIHWRICEVEQVRRSHSKGDYLASPEFSACGVSGFQFHFYPRGDDFAEEGFCSLYFHVPNGTKVERTLFLGRTRHGPAVAEPLRNTGVSEFCVLSNEIDKATGSIVVGVDDLKVISSENIVTSRTKLQLVAE